MEELDINLIKKRLVSGVFALGSRTFLLQTIAFSATFLLTIVLTPAIFGLFFVVSSLVNFLSYFSDIGLAAALVQKKEQISETDLSTTFTIQQILVGALVIIALAFSGGIANFYHLGSDGLWLFRVIVVSVLLSSLKTIPSILLERKLDFNRLVIPQIAETILFYGVAVVLAFRGMGIWSFTWAVLARGIVGLVLIYIISPWRISLGISKESAKGLLSFGIPFQTKSLLALLKDDLLTVFLGKVLSFTQVGYIGWAQKWAFTPLRLVMDNVIRVTFPAYSRLQHDTERLKVAIEKSLFFISLIVFPSLAAMVALAGPFTHAIPRYSKWDPALIALLFFSINAAWASVSTPLTNALDAVGKIKITLRLMIMWTVLTWVLTPTFIVLFGFNGVALASAVIATTSVVTVYLVRKVVPVDVVPQVLPALVGSLVMGVFLFFAGLKIPYSLVWLAGLVVLGVIIYLVCIAVLCGKRIVTEIRILKEIRNVNN